MTASIARNLASTTVVLAIALAIGFRPTAEPLRWLGVLGLLLLFMAAISWISAVFGLLARNVEAADATGFVVMFLPYLSSAFAPSDTMAGSAAGDRGAPADHADHADHRDAARAC